MNNQKVLSKTDDQVLSKTDDQMLSKTDDQCYPRRTTSVIQIEQAKAKEKDLQKKKKGLAKEINSFFFVWTGTWYLKHML